MIPRVNFKKPVRQNIPLTEIRYQSDKNLKQLPKNEFLPKTTETQIFSHSNCLNKENLQAIIIEKKKMETLQKRDLNTKNVFKLDYNCYGRSSTGNDNHKEAKDLSQTSLSQKDLFQMDSYCLKMSESIILSTDTIDSDPELFPGVSNDSFQRIKFLGQGKFGQVYLVAHKATGFVCAMKIISKKIIKQEQVESQIIKELKIHSSLKALNVITFYGFFDDQSSFYILLEYATQGCLLSKFKGRNRIQQEQIKPLTKGICEGLRYIHGMGYVHRDIKPENIVLQFGIPKICDFGWASQCDDINLCKSYCGTPLYLSPEIIKRQLYGTSVDIWSLGLLTYQLLVGRVPFSIWNEKDLILILKSQIKFPQYIDRSPQCEQFILGALQKDTTKRLSIQKLRKHPFLQNIPNSNSQYQIYEALQQIMN